jgi:branched-chain amino acid transport system ATP-binding protein
MLALLEVRNLSKSYGALRVTNEVSFSVSVNQIHAMIGPNGAGKTTLLAQLAGEVRPDAGTILFGGRDITRLPVAMRAPLGLSRSYQVASLFPEISARRNIELAVQGCSRWARCAWRAAGSIVELADRAEELLLVVDLLDRAEVLAGVLSHGEKRKLELAMALACRPKLLLLDEPLAGMGVEESRATVALLDLLRKDCAMVLVEHDVPAVLSLADRVSVLVNGKLVASGRADEISRDPLVRQSYLGSAAEAAC